ncbi:MAG: diguanylate cyclase [Planctomycetota bacterium]
MTEQPSTTPPETQDERPLVLVIDDSADVHRLLQVRLRGEPLELCFASTGSAGIDSARDRSPAIILLDLDMPGMDGFEVLRFLKDSAQTMDVPVIVLSGLQSPHDKVAAFDLGAIDYITKPFDLTELKVRVRSALRIHQLLDMLARRAQVDGLTGLYNRAHFDQRWPEAIATAQRHARPLSIALFDLDHFKSINDTYGHPAGDAVLGEFASILQSASRSSDVACRYGGEEFAIIMPDTSAEDAEILCERVRTMLEQTHWPKHPERTVTVSIGITGSSDGNGPNAPEWLERADKSLYDAKKTGRNRIVSSSTGGPRLAAAESA